MAQTEGITLPEVVTYDGLPGSAGGAHSLRAKRPDEAFRRLHRFVEACTEPVSSSWAFEIAAGGPDPATEQLVALATERFGGPRHRARTHTQWNVPFESVDLALDALIAVGPDAVTTHGRSLAALTYSTPVRLVDPDAGAPYPDITPAACGRFAVDGYGRLLGESGFRATLGTAASSLSLWLNLPADDRLSPGARHLQGHLPFRLSAKHWRLWRPTRSGDSYRSTKIPSPLHDQP
ncbi:hypothetical protein EGT67_22015 [Prescottella agglutinans]|uniref:Uncharacterized protein n=1 Tax=Prescottella agglutinans TaxID=1644129 RepID=A0A3S3AL09_9NOCA|nr:hypothetical protein [Prescottella agglutinans]RVW07239.1 hypothetical protein EGT67_22015 [Prescottella agglutinans]